MLYPQNFEQKIGFQQLREILESYCLSPLGLYFVRRMGFLDRFDLVQKLLLQSDEYLRLMNAGNDFPTQYYFDVNLHLQRAGIQNTFLEPVAFYEIKMSLKTVRASLAFFADPEAETLYPNLKALGANVLVERALIAAIEKVVDDNGQVKDDATPELGRIKRDLIAQQQLLRKQIHGILNHAKSQGWVNGDAEPTIRGGRLVIPVIAEFKRRLKGLIHDESATGQTVYIEPEPVFEVNNDIKDLENAYHRELIRILTLLTDYLRPHIPDLRKAYQYLGLLDFIRAKAVLARELGATLPKLHKQPLINWKSATHPLLFLSHKAQGRGVVPLNLELTADQRILLISGPNAGGKSVALKTAGLVQYMLQCGLLIPVGEGSEAGIFEDIFLDIGDEQSIENDLSTYSSHLQNMKQFVNFAGKKSLVLIDEFGTGTEPILGGAIAEAVLEKLNEQRVYGVITTHYTNLKNFAEKNPGIVNGAMRYDHKQLQPLYQLETGKPGSSFAIEIARKIGLPKDIVEKATRLVGKDKIRYDRLLEQLESEKNALEKSTAEVEKQQRKLDRMVKDYSALKEHLEESKTDILRDAKNQAKLLLRETNQQIEATISQIKHSQADKEKTKEARQQLQEFTEKKVKQEVKKTTRVSDNRPLAPGDKVSLIGQDSYGELVGVKGKTAEVLFGGMKTIVKLDNLQRATAGSAKMKPEKEAAQKSKSNINMTSRMADFNPSIDVRGERAEEALTKVMAFTDDAIMLGIPEIKIVHGRGTGILKQMIRDYLRSQREVASVSDEIIERGGDGATVVVLK